MIICTKVSREPFPRWNKLITEVKESCCRPGTLVFVLTKTESIIMEWKVPIQFWEIQMSILAFLL
jgi:hypothetical protein